jgi:surface antigen
MSIGLVGATLPASSAFANTVLCTGNDYSTCVNDGHTDHDFGGHNSTSYWGAYAGHNCTNYVAYVESTVNGATSPGNDLGNAKDWAVNAQAKGYTVNSAAAKGAVAQWDANAGGAGSSGHVAYVESVNADGSITISEDNYASGPFKWRTISSGASWPSNFIHFKDLSSSTDGQRVAKSDGSQYIFWRGIALPVGYGDAVAYNGEGNNVVSLNYTGSLPTPPLPTDTVLRPVGSGAQYLWDGSHMRPIYDGATSACLTYAFGSLAVVPAGWFSAQPTSSTAAVCSLADGTRFTQSDTGSQQYVSVRGAALPVSYGDAVAYNGEGDTALTSMPAGYIQQSIHAAVVPTNTMLRAAGSATQYFWDGTTLHPVYDGPTSACLLYAFPQNGVVLVPPSWLSTKAVGSTQQCSLPDGTRFTQTDTGSQQYVSVRGAALPVSYGDAVAYDGEGDTNLTQMPAGYVSQTIHAATLPAHTVLRGAGSPAQYFWDGTTLHYIATGAVSTCLLSTYPQNGIAVVPPGWESTLTVSGTNATC